MEHVWWVGIYMWHENHFIYLVDDVDDSFNPPRWKDSNYNLGMDLSVHL